MIKKETRILFPWLLGQCALATLLMFKSLLDFRASPINIHLYDFSIMWEPMLDNLAITVALSAVLGFWQFSRDTSADRWAFFISRPFSLSRLFVMRSGFGVIASQGALFFAFLIVSLWARSPSRMPMPFTWELGLPAVMNILLGIGWYLLGVAVALSDARWFATRLLPLGTGILCIAILHRLRTIPESLILIGIFAVLSALSAWGAFLGLRFPSRRPHLATVSAIAVILAGCLVISHRVVTIAEEYWPTESLHSDQYERYRLMSDGTVARTVQDFNGPERYFDLAGKEIDPHRVATEIALASASHTRLNDIWFSTPQSEYDDPSFRNGQKRFKLITENMMTMLWIDKKTDTLLLYDMRARRPGRSFPAPANDVQHAEALGIDTFGQQLVVAEHHIYRFDQSRPTLEILLTTPVDETITHLGTLPDPVNRRVIVLTSRRGILLNVDTLAAQSFHLPELDNSVHFSRAMTWLPNKQFLLHDATYPRGTGLLSMHHITRYDADVNLLESIDLPALASDPLGQFKRPDALPASAFSPLGVYLAKPAANYLGSAPFYIDNPSNTIYIYSATITALAALAAAFLARRRQLRWPLTATYILSTLLLGPLVLVALLGLHSLNVREVCPQCRRRTSAKNPRCSHCRQPLAAPKFFGIEIFEDYASDVGAVEGAQEGRV